MSVASNFSICRFQKECAALLTWDLINDGAVSSRTCLRFPKTVQGASKIVVWLWSDAGFGSESRKNSSESEQMKSISGQRVNSVIAITIPFGLY